MSNDLVELNINKYKISEVRNILSQWIKGILITVSGSEQGHISDSSFTPLHTTINSFKKAFAYLKIIFV